jgi:hypothetical protein
MNEEQRRLTYLRENVEQLHEEKTSLETLIHNLRISSEEEAIEILRRLRHGGTDAQTLSQNIQAGRALAQVSQPGSEGFVKYNVQTPKTRRNASTSAGTPSSSASQLDTNAQLLEVIAQGDAGETAEVVRRLRLREDADSIIIAIRSGSLMQPLEKSGSYSNPEQAFGLTRVGSGSATETQFRSSTHSGYGMHQPLPLHGNRSSNWMNAQEPGLDQDIINESMALYFAWQHCFFQSFPQSLFVQDMSSGSTQYCSRLLVNAVSSAGCHLSPWTHLPGGKQRPLEISKNLLEDAKHELSKINTPSIPTISGLLILGQLEGRSGRMDLAWDYYGRGARMALDLGLHLRSDEAAADGVETTARNHMFWGCFIADQ